MPHRKIKALEKEINRIDNGRIDIDHEKARLILGKGQRSDSMGNSVFNSGKLQAALGTDISVVTANNGGFDVYSGPGGNPAAYIDTLGAVHTLPGGSDVATRVRAALRNNRDKGRGKNGYVNIPRHLR